MCSRCRQVTKEVDREKGKKLGRGLLRPDALNTREKGEKQGDEVKVERNNNCDNLTMF